MNPSFTVSEVEATASQARLVIEPLEQGYGHTLGNALRRVLLTSLPGSAITSVAINGVDHQFTTLEGLSEDIVEFILNIKQVKVKADHDGMGILRLNVQGPAKITAADIKAEAGFEIINGDQPLATLAKGKKLEVEMTVETDTGYKMVAEMETEVIGQIAIDALFSPVEKVSYKVESTRVGRRTDFDRIVLEVQTDGTITPLEAVKQAAQILAKQFTQIFDPVIIENEEEETQLSPEEAETLRLTVEELDLPTRIANALRKGGYKTVGDLISAPKETISKVKNLGGKSVDLINEALQKKGVSLED
ncbi:MAG: DNA-directed RNA polymerase subunit alpha [Candidatus Pacebacteria bacterium RIFOXYB1_FULL_39_46]|nr:MAG: DNA-directed RNA polymerase subunit alpha [Candidatus Pacebacteria bacterium RIFOXYB1_FULL_39_46]OGJ39151.1 MAG: DNA-directed RNA polymerase subunit alpha [Candidatus Pacebacteria bacterium RIFOXYA1_FULL_38_18]OGJ40040.1 MAG: DNA-directed RNA polymerase subunit alpha [Candidatus Pacebacteria bacterium RIFOXYD1_FULL_39_27]OGJ40781.1 MAG: DNA-directed RNA polymerase subunit alpha [Candidatus Pacebacteria bacterium RIFOXYC1_FULL_39_21]